MRRRALVGGGLLAALATSARAQERRRIAILHSGYPERTPIHLLIEALRALGYDDGRSASIELLGGEGDPARLAAQVARIAAARPDVVVAITPPAVLALQRAGVAVPIVFLFVTDPVAQGIVATLARPGGTVTGVSSGDAGIGAKRLELLGDALPGARRIAVLWSAAFGDNRAMLENTREAAAARGVALFVREIHGAEDLESAFDAAASASVQAGVFMTDNALFGQRRTVAALALARRLPTIHNFPIEVQDGGLMSFSVDVPDRYRRGAALVDKILRGVLPADIPVEQPTTFTLAVNLRTARALGVVFPQAFLARADTVIE